MNRIHDSEGISTTDDAQEIVHPTEAGGCIRHAGICAATGRDVAIRVSIGVLFHQIPSGSADHRKLAVGGIVRNRELRGLVAQLPTPEWRAMLSDARAFFFDAPRSMLLPGLAVCVAVFGFNLPGDGLRDALDPMHASHVRRVGA